MDRAVHESQGGGRGGAAPPVKVSRLRPLPEWLLAPRRQGWDWGFPAAPLLAGAEASFSPRPGVWGRRGGGCPLHHRERPAPWRGGPVSQKQSSWGAHVCVSTPDGLKGTLLQSRPGPLSPASWGGLCTSGNSGSRTNNTRFVSHLCLTWVPRPCVRGRGAASPVWSQLGPLNRREPRDMGCGGRAGETDGDTERQRDRHREMQRLSNGNTQRKRLRWTESQGAQVLPR